MILELVADLAADVLVSNFRFFPGLVSSEIEVAFFGVFVDAGLEQEGCAAVPVVVATAEECLDVELFECGVAYDSATGGFGGVEPLSPSHEVCFGHGFGLVLVVEDVEVCHVLGACCYWSSGLRMPCSGDSGWVK